MICKHFNTIQGCSYGDKCQFAHGPQELRLIQGQISPSPLGDMQSQQKNSKNPLNYKIVKCKNYEKDKTCKYGEHCTFAHGDSELRSKSDNLTHLQQEMTMMNQPFMNEYGFMNIGMLQGFDMNQIAQMGMTGQIDPNALMMGINMNPQGMDPSDLNLIMNQVPPSNQSNENQK